MSLKKLRISKGYKTQREFAVAIGKKNTTVSMWENGFSKPKLKDIPVLMRALNESAEVILACFEQEGNNDKP